MSMCLAACCAFSACADGGKVSEPTSSSDNGETDAAFTEFDYSDYTDMGKTVNLANRLANGVQAYYTDAAKEAYTIENNQARLTHNLTASGQKFVSDLSSVKGGRYLFNTMDVYIERDEDLTFARDSEYAGFVNTDKLGYYYYETNVRDLMMDPSLYVEKTYHVYSDRIYQEFRLLAAATVGNLDGFGFETKLRGETVEKIEIFDGENTYSSIDDDYDPSKVQYVAFDIKDAGVVAFIDSGDDCSVTVTKNPKGNYTLRQSVSLTGETIAVTESVIIGNRLYTDDTHDFAGVRKANYEERHPLTSDQISVDTSVDKARFTGYDRFSGAYTFFIDGTDFASAYNHPEKKYYEKIRVENAPDDREVFFYIHSTNPLEGAAIMDKNELLLPMGLEVCKNFNHEKEEPVYDPEDSMYGDTLFPFSVEKDKTIDFTVLNVYQNWGDYPLKQLSSIAYYVSYYHLSTGIRETNCIAPYFSARSGRRDFGNSWILPDFRGASCDPKTQADSSGQQRDSVGTLCGVSDGTDLGNYQSSYIRSAGLTYADLDYSYISADGSYKYTYRHAEMPQLDESRTYYTVEIEFLKDKEIDPTRFSIFGFDGRNAVYKNAAYLGENGEAVVLDDLAMGTDSTVGESKLYKLNKGSSWFTYYNIASMPGENGNFGLIVKDYSITVNGENSDVGMAFYDSARNSLNFGSLTISEKTDFKVGDKITVNAVLLPYGSRSGQTNYDSVLNVYEDTVKTPLVLTACRGSVADDWMIPSVVACQNVAEFTVSGGTSGTAGVNYTIKAEGFTKLGKPLIRELINGTWVTVDYSSEVGFDGYSVSYENGKITYSFVIAKFSEDRTFKIMII